LSASGVTGVWAEKDPLGAHLDRIQIIKGWSEDAKPRVKIFDVALSDGRVADANGLAPPVGKTVDVANASYTNDVGAPKLSAMWIDPEFNPVFPTFYYVRVLQIPTPRCAFTSPIWYKP